MRPFPFRWLIYFLRNQFTSFWSIWWTKKIYPRYYATISKQEHSTSSTWAANFPVVNVGFFMFVTDNNQSARNYCFHYFLVSLWWPSFYCFTVRKVGILVYNTHSVFSTVRYSTVRIHSIVHNCIQIISVQWIILAEGTKQQREFGQEEYGCSIIIRSSLSYCV